MKTILLLALCACAFSADPGNLTDWKGGKTTQVEALKPAPTVTAEDLQNLAVCARMQLQNLTADQIAAVALAIKHAEADIAEMRKPAPVEAPKPPSGDVNKVPVQVVETKHL